MEILIKNTRLVDGNIDTNGDIYLKGGYIEDIGENLKYKCHTIDGSKLCVMPSFIDLHVHFRDPVATHKEDLTTGSRAALKGGYTYTNLMYDSNDQWSISKTLDYIYYKNKALDLIDIHQSIFIGRHNSEDAIEILKTADPRVRIVVVERSGFIKNSIFLKVLTVCKEKNMVLILLVFEKRNLNRMPCMKKPLFSI